MMWFNTGQEIFTEAGGASCTLEGEAININVLSQRSSVGALDKATLVNGMPGCVSIWIRRMGKGSCVPIFDDMRTFSARS